jgi:hypothetical protein
LRLGISVDVDTIRKWLRTSAEEELPQGDEKNSTCSQPQASTRRAEGAGLDGEMIEPSLVAAYADRI